MRKSTWCILAVCADLLLMGLICVHAHFGLHRSVPMLAGMAETVSRLELTDLCLFTESRYTRHLSQTDRYSAFQEHPVSLEHFPAGSVAPPPGWLRRPHGVH